MRTTRLAPALALALSLTLAGCGAGETATDAGPAAPTGTPSTSAGASAFNDTDVRFTQSMLPHHQQAARNAEIQIESGEDPRVVALARQILEAQTAEIETMRGFLAEFGAEEEPAPADQQAVWDKNTADLRDAATPAARDVVFLTTMVPHHAAAIPMSQTEIELGTYPEAVALAEDIKAAQRKEIMEMTKILREKAGTA